MDIYAIRKNKCAGVYTSKEVFEFIKDKEHKCSIRIFDKREEKEALKWAGVKKIDDIPSMLKADIEFNKILNNTDKKETKNGATEKNIESVISDNSVGLHRTKGLTQTFLDVNESPKDKRSASTEQNKTNCSAIEDIIENLKDKYETIMIRTKSFGDLFFLSDFWYYEKNWDIEYAYSNKELLEYGFIKYKLNTELVSQGNYIRLYNYYTSKKRDSILANDIVSVCNELIILNENDICGLVPIDNFLMQWDVDGELMNFNSKDDKSDTIRKLTSGRK